MEKKLIGLKVQHRQSRKIGEIQAVNNNELAVSYYGNIEKYSYPDCFETILDLEDEDILKEIRKVSKTANFHQFKQTFKQALLCEINYLKCGGGKKYRVIDGERLPSQNGEYIYAFDTDTELHFPDGTPLKLWMNENIINAYVISCEEYIIMIRLSEFIGEFVETLEFTVEQWALLEALMERMDEMNVDANSIAYELACFGNTHINKMKSIMCGQDYAFKRAESKQITFIWGPPGTGKTHTLANIALDSMKSGKRVLMLSYSNVSVDGALLRVEKISDLEPGQVIRYGYPRMKEILDSNYLTSYQYVLSKNPKLAEEYQILIAEKKKLKRKDGRRIEINKKLNKIKRELLEKEKEVIQSSAFVATTVSKAVIDKAIYSQKFDVVIFDEASMAYIPQVVFASSLAKSNFICLGDFCQLPAIVQNNTDEYLRRDIFEHTGITTAIEDGYGHEWLVMLNVQYRMHHEIADFASRHMYGGKLISSSKIYESRKEIASCTPFEYKPMALYDLSYMYSVCMQTMEKSRINLLSALISVRLAEQYIREYEVGIITPYNAQSRLILAMVRDMQERNNQYGKISCATVHQFQGSEKPIIIYDAVDCFRMPYPGTLLTSMKFNQANRLFNVALTRAQGKFILVANRDFMMRKHISPKLMFTEAMRKMYSEDLFIDGEDAIWECIPDENEIPEVYVDDVDETWKDFIKDIKNARKIIQIDVPGMLRENDVAIEQFINVLEKKEEEGVTIHFRIDEDIILPKPLMKYTIKHSYVINPVTIIDKKVIWFGQPLSGADFITEGKMLETKYFPCVRFVGEYTARALQAYLELQ